MTVALDVLQVGAHGLGNTRPDPLVGRLARDVGERDDGNRVSGAATIWPLPLPLPSSRDGPAVASISSS